MKIIAEKVNRINIKYFRFYFLLLLIWGVLGIVSFPNKLFHVLIIGASATSLMRIKGYTNQDDKNSIFILCWILSIIGLLIMFF